MTTLSTKAFAFAAFSVASSLRIALAQDIGTAMHLYKPSDGAGVGYAPTMNWLSATCQTSTAEARSTCLAVIYNTVERMELDRKLCLPVELSSVFEFALSEIVKYSPDRPVNMNSAERKKAFTPIWEGLGPPMRKHYPCKKS